jgi:hypothetical protein
LATGGKERVVLDLVGRSRAAGFDDRVLLFDQPAWSDNEFDPGDIPVEFTLRQRGVDCGCAKRMADAMSDLRTDIVHAHNDTALFYAALAIRRLHWKRRLSPRRLVATYHNLPTHPGWRARLAARWAARSANVLVAVSRELHRTLVDRKPRDTRRVHQRRERGRGPSRREVAVGDRRTVESCARD